MEGLGFRGSRNLQPQRAQSFTEDSKHEIVSHPASRCNFVTPVFSQDRGAWLSSLPEAKDYVSRREELGTTAAQRYTEGARARGKGLEAQGKEPKELLPA